MGIRVDFSNVDTFEPIPSGTYVGTVTNVEVRESQSSEYNFLNWEITIVSGEYQGRKVWLITSLSPKAVWKLKEALIAFGCTEEGLSGEVDIEPEDYIGAECEVIVIQENYQGQLRSRVDSVLPLSNKTLPLTQQKGPSTPTLNPKTSVSKGKSLKVR